MLIKKIIWFFLGSLCFIISQPLLRLPILKYMQNNTDFVLVYTLNPLLTGILIAFSAGVFEEGFRFLFKQYFLKPNNCRFSQPIIFGLGHGIAEAMYILLPALSMVSVSQLGPAFLERILAIILHINLTVLVWNGFQRKRKFLFLILAIVIHGLVDSLIPILQPYSNMLILIEGSLLVIDILISFYSSYSRKYYVHKEEVQ